MPPATGAITAECERPAANASRGEAIARAGNGAAAICASRSENHDGT